MATLIISGRIGNVVHVSAVESRSPAREKAGLETPGGRLLLRRDTRGPFHALCGERVECGDLIELCRADDSWLLGQYAWAYRPSDRPSLVVDERSLELASTDILRWPNRH
jgi:hypothetical protein